jgi:predicted amino acid dehydrogenase
MMEAGRNQVLPRLTNAIQTAADWGATIVGLGAFTSIMSRGGEDLLGSGVFLTTGNTMSAVMAVESIHEVADRTGLDMSHAHVAVVGATGSIGRLAAFMLANSVKSLTLVGNAASPDALPRLRAIADEIRDQPGIANLALHYTVDLASSLRDADVVLVATNSAQSCIEARYIKTGAIICDVCRPPSVRDDINKEVDVLVFDGGLVQLPQALTVGPLRSLDAGISWGCFGETLLLALEGEANNFSIGQKLSLEGARHIATLAKKHGFHPPKPRWNGRDLSEADFAKVRRERVLEALGQSIVSI